MGDDIIAAEDDGWILVDDLEGAVVGDGVNWQVCRFGGADDFGLVEIKEAVEVGEEYDWDDIRVVVGFASFFVDCCLSMFVFFVAEDAGAGGAADPDFFGEDFGQEVGEAGSLKNGREVVGVAAEAENHVGEVDAGFDMS